MSPLGGVSAIDARISLANCQRGATDGGAVSAAKWCQAGDHHSGADEDDGEEAQQNPRPTCQHHAMFGPIARRRVDGGLRSGSLPASWGDNANKSVASAIVENSRR